MEDGWKVPHISVLRYRLGTSAMSQMDETPSETLPLGGSVTPQGQEVRSNIIGRSWCYTLHKPTTEHIERLKSLECRRHVCGHEFGSKSGAEHLQGYIRFEKPCRMSYLKKFFPTMHLEIRRGSEKQASDYCKKDGRVIIDVGVDADGVKKYATSGDELDAIFEEIDAGEPYGAIYMRHRRYCATHRRIVLDAIYDSKKIRLDPQWDPVDVYKDRWW